MWIPPSNPTEEDEDVVEDPQYVQQLIQRLKTPAEEGKQSEAENIEDYLRRTAPFRKIAEELGIVFTRPDLKEILANKKNLSKYGKLLPFILQEFPKFDDFSWKNTFGHLLGTPLAGEEGAKALIQGFLHSQHKWETSSFLEKNPHPSVASDMIKIVQNPEYGMARQRVIVALAKTRDPRAFDVITKLINVPELTGHVIEAFSIMGNPRALPLIEPHLQNEMAWIRKVAAKVLKQLPLFFYSVRLLGLSTAEQSYST